VLFINPRSGGGTAERAGVADLARERGVEVVVFGPGADLEALSGEAIASGADALGVAGGDGSLAPVAASALAHRIPFVCIPAGTRNHFALDLGVDRRDVIGALDAFTDGVERVIDVARVNGRLFLNNVSLGVYGDAVSRAEYRDAKMRTILRTARAVLGPGGVPTEIKLVDDRGRAHLHPTILVISNNPYALHQPIVTGTRPSLTTGQLGILVVDGPAEGMSSRREPARTWTATSLEVDAPVLVHAGVDGEPVELQPPLEFVTVPAALRVRIASGHPGVSPSGR
jgi:diacylglycerol kinase family enzyme